MTALRDYRRRHIHDPGLTDCERKRQCPGCPPAVQALLCPPGTCGTEAGKPTHADAKGHVGNAFLRLAEELLDSALPLDFAAPTVDARSRAAGEREPGQDELAPERGEDEGLAGVSVVAPKSARFPGVRPDGLMF